MDPPPHPTPWQGFLNDNKNYNFEKVINWKRWRLCWRNLSNNLSTIWMFISDLTVINHFAADLKANIVYLKIQVQLVARNA